MLDTVHLLLGKKHSKEELSSLKEIESISHSVLSDSFRPSGL